MIKVTIDNSMCRVDGLTPEQHKLLRTELSYVEAGSAFGGYGPQRRFLLSNKGEYPTGLHYLVVKTLRAESLEYAAVDLRKAPKILSKPLVASFEYTPYPEQIEAAKAAKRFKRGIVVAPTGLGKSVIAALIIQELQVRTLVVVPSLELKRQLTEGLSATFGRRKCGGLADGREIAVENVDSLDPKQSLKGYDCVIVDEFHHSGAKTYRNLNKKAWAGVYHKIGLTATPFRSQDDERLLLESVLSQVIYRVDYSIAVSKGYIVPMEAYYYELPKRGVLGNTWAAVYKELVVTNRFRNALVGHLIDHLSALNISTLCLVKEIAHGEALLKYASFANGQDEDCANLIKEFNQGGTALVATTGVCGEGVDTKPAEFIIIAGLGKSKNSFMQQVGRGFRRYGNKESCKVILFRDPSHKWTRDHFNHQVKYLKEEYGVTAVKLPLPEGL